MWSRRIVLALLALAAFGAPLLAIPSLASQSGLGVWKPAGLSGLTVTHLVCSGGGDFPLCYAAVRRRGVYRSLDGGQSWRPANVDLPSGPWGERDAHGLAVDPLEARRVYVALEGGRLYRSINGASRWQEIPAPPGLTDVTFLGLVPGGGDLWLYVAGGGRLWRSRDEEAAWRLLGRWEKPGAVQDVMALPHDPGRLCAAVGSGGLWCTEDAGQGWEKRISGLGSSAVRRLLHDPQDPEVWFAGTHNGVYRSENRGAIWQPARAGLPGVSVQDLVALEGGSLLLFAALRDAGVAYTTDGAHWQALNRGLGHRDVWVVRQDPMEANVLYAGTSDGLWRVRLAFPTQEAVPTPEPPMSTPTPTGTATPTPVPTRTPTATPMLTPTPPQRPATPPPTTTATWTPAPSGTPTETATSTLTSSPAPSPTALPSPTLSPTASPVPPPAATPPPRPTPTSTPIPPPTATPRPTATPPR